MLSLDVPLHRAHLSGRLHTIRTQGESLEETPSSGPLAAVARDFFVNVRCGFTTRGKQGVGGGSGKFGRCSIRLAIADRDKVSFGLVSDSQSG
jgi:hypothetical protein